MSLDSAISRKSYSAILLSASCHSSEKCSSDHILRRCVMHAYTTAKPPCTVAVDDCSEQLKSVSYIQCFYVYLFIVLLSEY